MKSFEFMHGGEWYRYENGYIMKQRGFDFYDNFCPVLVDLHDKFDGLAADQLHSIMGAIIHGYCTGFARGREDKIREIKRVLKLD